MVNVKSFKGRSDVLMKNNIKVKNEEINDLGNCLTVGRSAEYSSAVFAYFQISIFINVVEMISSYLSLIPFSVFLWALNKGE